MHMCHVKVAAYESRHVLIRELVGMYLLNSRHVLIRELVYAYVVEIKNEVASLCATSAISTSCIDISVTYETCMHLHLEHNYISL